MAGMRRGDNFILVTFLFFWCPSWGLGSEHTPTNAEGVKGPWKWLVRPITPYDGQTHTSTMRMEKD